MKRGMLQLSTTDISRTLQYIELPKLQLAQESSDNPVAIELNEEEIEDILDALPADEHDLRTILQQFLLSVRMP